MAMQSFCMSLVSPKTESTFLAYDLVLGVPSVAFLAFLGWTAKSSLRKLHRFQSHLLTTYYGALWLVAILNTVRVLVQVLEGFSQQHLAIWNTLWLLTRFGLTLLELSILVSVLQGGLATGPEVLRRVLIVSGSCALVESCVMALVVGAMHESLFFYGGTEELTWGKWGFWLIHGTLFLAVYTALLVLPGTRWREFVPAKPPFYRYVFLLFLVNLLASIGAIMLGSGAGSGYCIYGTSNFLYYALYPPLMYYTFLAEFFRGSAESDVDLLLYSEMRDAGVFENQGEEF